MSYRSVDEVHTASHNKLIASYYPRRVVQWGSVVVTIIGTAYCPITIYLAYVMSRAKEKMKELKGEYVILSDEKKQEQIKIREWRSNPN